VGGDVAGRDHHHVGRRAALRLEDRVERPAIDPPVVLADEPAQRHVRVEGGDVAGGVAGGGEAARHRVAADLVHVHQGAEEAHHAVPVAPQVVGDVVHAPGHVPDRLLQRRGAHHRDHLGHPGVLGGGAERQGRRHRVADQHHRARLEERRPVDEPDRGVQIVEGRREGEPEALAARAAVPLGDVALAVAVREVEPQHGDGLPLPPEAVAEPLRERGEALLRLPERRRDDDHRRRDADVAGDGRVQQRRHHLAPGVQEPDPPRARGRRVPSRRRRQLEERVGPGTPRPALGRGRPGGGDEAHAHLHGAVLARRDVPDLGGVLRDRVAADEEPEGAERRPGEHERLARGHDEGEAGARDVVDRPAAPAPGRRGVDLDEGGRAPRQGAAPVDPLLRVVDHVGPRAPHPAVALLEHPHLEERARGRAVDEELQAIAGAGAAAGARPLDREAPPRLVEARQRGVPRARRRHRILLVAAARADLAGVELAVVAHRHEHGAPAAVSIRDQRTVQIDRPRQQRVPPRLRQRRRRSRVRKQRERQLAAGAGRDHDQIGRDRIGAIDLDARHAGVLVHRGHAGRAPQHHAARQRRTLEQPVQFVVADAERRRKAQAREPLGRQFVQVAAVAVDHVDAAVGKAGAHAVVADAEGDEVAQHARHDLDVRSQRTRRGGLVEHLHAQPAARRGERGNGAAWAREERRRWGGSGGCRRGAAAGGRGRPDPPVSVPKRGGRGNGPAQGRMLNAAG